MRISGSFITMLIIWVLGFTHFLGGPYIFFKVIFWLALLPFFVAIFMLILVAFKARKIFRTSSRIENQETIHVEVEVKE